jgi:hypothetical protein
MIKGRWILVAGNSLGDDLISDGFFVKMELFCGRADLHPGALLKADVQVIKT